MDYERRQSDFDTKAEVKKLSTKVDTLATRVVRHLKEEETQREGLTECMSNLETRVSGIEKIMNSVKLIGIFILGGTTVGNEAVISAMKAIFAGQ